MGITQHKTLGFVACATAGMFWGTGFFFGKIALAEMSVGHMVFYRFFFAAISLIPVLVKHRPELDGKEWGLLLLGSFLGVPLQFLLQFKGLSLTTVSHAALMVGLMPVLLATGATIFAHERLDRIGWISLAGSTAGAALIAAGGRHGGNGASLVGDLLVIASLFIALGWILLNKKLMQHNSHMVVTAWGILAGMLMLCILIPVQYGLPPVHGVSMKAWLSLAASGVLCTATTTLLWNWGITQVPASQAGVFLNMEPLIGSLLGVFLLGERLGPAGTVGGALILVAAVMLTTQSKTRTREVDAMVA